MLPGYEVAYLPENPPIGMKVINYFVDCCFMLDVLVNFFAGYYDAKHETWVLSLSEIRSNYLRGWFIIDFGSGMPWDFIAQAIRRGETSTPDSTCHSCIRYN